jgi:hypothetical protein
MLNDPEADGSTHGIRPSPAIFNAT